MHSEVPPVTEAGEITVQDLKREELEANLTVSNWRFFRAFRAMQSEPSPVPGTGRRDDAQTDTKGTGHES